MTKNRHLVSRRQWKKWSEQARAVFNETYELMLDQALINAHPKAAHRLSDEHWVTVAWNAAFIAAGAVEHFNRA